MRKRLSVVFLIFGLIIMPCFGALHDRFINSKLYSGQYPNTINQDVKRINSSSSATGNAVSSNKMGKRRVVQRKNIARAAATSQNVKTLQGSQQQNRRVVSRNNTARSATSTTPIIRNNSTTTTNARGNNNQRKNVVARGANRNSTSSRSTNDTTTTSSSTVMTSQRCFAGYKECMEDYCKREDTAYNRCFCSAKLSQIDSRYQNKIDSLIQQIIKLQYNSDATSDEIKEYWDKTMGTYTGTNPWVNIDNALNIKWADTESRVRGQKAFNTGHQYCVNFLKSCSSMASNMRDAYKSEITRDCATYESSLQKIQAAAESVIESYND